jgi:hypothetical protein
MPPGPPLPAVTQIVTPKTMPIRGHATAPAFAGDPLDLQPFFDEINSLGNEAQITEGDKIRCALRYIRREDYELWSTLDESKGVDFAAFRKAVITFYPGAEEERRYNETDLRNIVDAQRSYGLCSRADLGLYYREFSRVSKFLVAEKKISTTERDKYFIQGFEGAFHQRVIDRLQYMNPLHYPDDPYDWQVVHECAKFLLAGTTATITAGNVLQRVSPFSQITTVYSAPTATVYSGPTGPVYTGPVRQMYSAPYGRAFQAPVATDPAQQAVRYATPAAPTYAPPPPAQASTYAPPPPAQAPAAATQPVKTEAPDMQETMRNMEARLEKGFAEAIFQAMRARPRGSDPTRPSSARLSDAAVQEIVRCFFCGKPECRIKDCLTVQDYISRSLAKRDDYGRVVLPNGGSIPRWCMGRFLKDRIDHYHQNPNGPPSTATTRDSPPHMPSTHSQNLLEVVETLHTAVNDDPSDEDGTIYKILQTAAEHHRNKKVRFDGVEVPTRKTADKGKAVDRPPPPAAPVASGSGSAPRQDDIRERLAQIRERPKDTPAPVAQQRSAVQRPASNTGNNAPANGPQYRYSSPVEDPALVSAVLARALQSTVSLSQKELLTISPEIRRQMKDLTKTNRVTTGSYEEDSADINGYEEVEVFANTDFSTYDRLGELVVGKDSVSLRSVFPVLEGKLTVECVLDSGCQIVAMKDTIWEQLGNNLQVEERMSMEAANSSVTSSSGRLRNVRFTFGDIDIYLQVQVMSNPPYDVLLGRPFTTLTECVTKDFVDGDQHITIRDPNSGRLVTIPTKERKRNRRPDPDF